MAQQVKVWYDAEGDFLEVLFSDEAGYMRPTDRDEVMERVDEKGRLLGFSITNVSRLRGSSPLTAQLTAAVHGHDAA
jgi:hypothetical protein